MYIVVNSYIFLICVRIHVYITYTPHMAPARPRMTHIHVTHHVLASLVYALCDTHYTYTQGTLTKTIGYNGATTVMQSVAILKYEL